MSSDPVADMGRMAKADHGPAAPYALKCRLFTGLADRQPIRLGHRPLPNPKAPCYLPTQIVPANAASGFSSSSSRMTETERGALIPSLHAPGSRPIT